jgi:DNA-binding Xre family transcriptional regulator
MAQYMADVDGEALRIHRQRRGLTQTELADMAGTSKFVVSRLETGAMRRVKTATAELLAAALDVEDGAFARAAWPPSPAVRPTGGRTRPAGEAYRVEVCWHCQHPGGQHILNGGCRLCADCAGYQSGDTAMWSDRMTADVLAERTPAGA